MINILNKTDALVSTLDYNNITIFANVDSHFKMMRLVLTYIYYIRSGNEADCKLYLQFPQTVSHNDKLIRTYVK